MNIKLLFLLVLLVFPVSVFAQNDSDYAWCGYALIENLVIDEPQLENLSRLFPPPDESRPSQTMSYLQSDDGYTTILQGCWLSLPDRQIVVSMIEQADGLSYADADLNLVYYEFTGETRVESAAAARLYILENIKRFNGDPEDDYEN